MKHIPLADRKKVKIIGGWNKDRIGNLGTIIDSFVASKQSSAYNGITNARIYRVLFADNKTESFLKDEFEAI